MEDRRKKVLKLIYISIFAVLICNIWGIQTTVRADKEKRMSVTEGDAGIYEGLDVKTDNTLEKTAESTDTADSASDDNVVRVAYVISDNFQQGGEHQWKYGYGYEYLQKISYYTGWRYEYVYGSYDELLAELENGEIDLMGDIVYSESRGQLFNYSKEIQGVEYYYLYTYSNRDDLNGSDLSTLDGIKIGINKGSYQLNLFKKWSTDRNIDCEIIEYSDEEQRIKDLAAGKIDVVLAAENYKGDNLVPLCQLGEVPFYFGVSKSRTDLLEQLDNAMSEIFASNINYNSQLRAKYMTSSVSVTTLTNNEKEWLQENGICVGYLSDYMPYCGTDKETGQMTGMLADLLSNIKEEYSIYCTTISYDSYSELMAALQNGEVDAVFPFYGDYSIAEYMNVMVSDAVTQTSMTVFNGESVRKEVQKIAVTDTDPFQKYYASIYYPEAEQIACESLADCVDSVIAGETEFTVVETARVNESENTKYKKRLQTLILNESVNISFAINIGNKELINIINKAIMSTDDSLITNSLIYHSQEDAHYTVMDFMREHVVLVVIIIVVIFGIITANIVLYFVNRMRSQRRIWEAETKEKNVRWKAEHDSLTGLLNRASFQEICKDLQESVSPLAILVIDVDKFKSVNDTYGHETGDKALVKVAQILNLYFRSGDYVIRYAGDEFVVLMIGITPSETNVIAAKIEKINENLQHPQEDLPKLSLSVGIAFSEKGYTEDLFNKADQALYHTKEHGRCGYSVYGK